jgi:HK97 gp10 family phage protein
MNLKLMFDRTSPAYTEVGVMAGGKVIAAAAKDFVPVDTGDLQSTIRVVPGKRDGSKSSCYVTAGGRARSGNDVNYAGFVEFGTSRMAARPFLRPAYDKFKQAAVKETGDAVFATIVDPHNMTITSGFALPPRRNNDWNEKF